SVAPAAGNEDTPIPLTILSAVSGPVGTTLSITVAGVPAGATLSAGVNNGGGVWTLTPGRLIGLTLTPPANSEARLTLAVTPVRRLTAAPAAAGRLGLPVPVTAVADAPTPTVAAATGNEASPIPLAIAAALTDTDGSESLLVTIAGVPAGATLSAGVNNGGGV